MFSCFNASILNEESKSPFTVFSRTVKVHYYHHQHIWNEMQVCVHCILKAG